MISEPPINRYNGYNPEFYQRVMEKRRREELARKAEEARQAIEKAQEEAPQRKEDNRPIKGTMREAITIFAIQEGVTYEDIIGRSKKAAITDIRQRCICEVYRQFPLKSHVEIGLAFNRDHTTIIYVLQKQGVWERDQRAPYAQRMVEPKKAASMYRAGKSITKIADYFGVSRETIRRSLRFLEREAA